MYLRTSNIRGLNNPCKIVEVKKFISQNKLNIFTFLKLE